MEKNKNTIAKLIHAFYQTLSGTAGQERDWEKLRTLCFTGTQLIRTSISSNNIPKINAMDIEI